MVVMNIRIQPNRMRRLLASGLLLGLACYGACATSTIRANESTSSVLRRYGIYAPQDNARPYANDGTATRRYGSYQHPQHYVTYRGYYSAPLYRPWYWYPYAYGSQPWYRPFYAPYVPFSYWGAAPVGWYGGMRWYPRVSYYYGGVPGFGGCYYW